MVVATKTTTADLQLVVGGDFLIFARRDEELCCRHIFL